MDESLGKEKRNFRIAIVVHGRFYAFDLTRVLLERGHEVVVFTNYPRWATARFGISKEHVQSHWLHGICVRLVERLWVSVGNSFFESFLHRWFSRWAARRVARQKWDHVYCFSGVAEELFKALKSSSQNKWLVRGSAHIRTQTRILEDEERRAGIQPAKASPWMIAREEREYTLADRIVVLSEFARRSFIEEGVPERKIVKICLGSSTERNVLSREESEARKERVSAGSPLRVLYTGTVSCRKGVVDLAHIIKTLAGDKFEFKLVGPLTKEATIFCPEIIREKYWVPKVEESDLRSWYAWADLYLFPTLEDGFAVVLAQAHAAGLPILATSNCGAPDFIVEGETGWLFPIRTPERFVERLRWCQGNRRELVEMLNRIGEKREVRTWLDVAIDHENAFKTWYEDHGKNIEASTQAACSL